MGHLAKLQKAYEAHQRLSAPRHFLDGQPCSDRPQPAAEAVWETRYAGRTITRRAEKRANEGHRSSLDGSWSNGSGHYWVWGPETVEVDEAAAEKAEAARVAYIRLEDALPAADWPKWRVTKESIRKRIG